MKFHCLRVAAILGLSGSFLHAQSLTVAPGLTISNGGVPWALDTFQGKSELVPIHHSTVEVNNHKGANVAESLAGSFFYKPKLTVELAGLRARTVLHAAQPSIYLSTRTRIPTRAEIAQRATQWSGQWYGRP